MRQMPRIRPRVAEAGQNSLILTLTVEQETLVSVACAGFGVSASAGAIQVFQSKEHDMRKIRKSLLVSLIMGLLPVLSWAGPVDINTADAGTLARELNGIGAAKAEAIVAYREQFGPFKSADDLARVQGVGSRILEINRGNILVSKPGTAGSKSK